MSRTLGALCIPAVGLAAAIAVAFAAPSGGPVNLPDSPVSANALRAQLAKERAAWRVERRVLRARARAVVLSPDAEVAMRLAGIAFGVDWRALRSCALSEGYRLAERYRRRIGRTNREGSGATGPWQFMRSTFLSTPFARLDWLRVDVQAMATAWMFAHGRRGEWAGAGCR